MGKPSVAAKKQARPGFAPAPGPKDPLWKINCRIVGVTGEVSSGKTSWLLSINPDPATTLYYDFEFSADSYAPQIPGLGYVNVGLEMAKSGFALGYKPYDLWKWWERDITKRLSSKTYKLVVVDPATELEDGLTSLIQAKPRDFGLSPNQILKAKGLLWAAFNSHWKRAIFSIAGQSVFAFSVHMRNVWEGERPTSKREAQIKPSLAKMATLFLQLVRKPVDGEVPRIPSARVIKDRLSKFVVGADGNLQQLPVLPSFIKECTPAKIRWYIDNPVGFREFTAEEKVPDQKLSAEEKLELKIRAAEAKKEAAEAQAEATEKLAELEAARQRIRRENTKEPVVFDNAVPDVKPEPSGRGGKIEDLPRSRLIEVVEFFRKEMLARGQSPEKWQASIEKRGAKTLEKMSDGALRNFAIALDKRLGIPW